MASIVQLVFKDRSKQYVCEGFGTDPNVNQARIAYSDASARGLVRHWTKIVESGSFRIYESVVAIEIVPVNIVPVHWR
jgi:hypothetical protein